MRGDVHAPEAPTDQHGGVVGHVVTMREDLHMAKVSDAREGGGLLVDRRRHEAGGVTVVDRLHRRVEIRRRGLAVRRSETPPRPRGRVDHVHVHKGNPPGGRDARISGGLRIGNNVPRDGGAGDG